MTVTVRSTPFAVLTTLLALACDRPEELPDMGVSRSALSFEAPATGEPAPQTVFVQNTGRGSLSAPTTAITYADGAGWLAATVTGGGAPYTVTVQPTTAELSPGVYEAALTLSSANATSSPVQVDVTLTVPDPRFTLSTDHLDLAAPRGGGDPAPGTFQIVNGGRGALPVPEVAVSYVGPTGWLSTAVSGTPDAYTVTVIADAAGFDSGTYTATLAISAPAAEGPPRSLVVTLTVPPAEVAVSTRVLSIEGPSDVGDPAPVEIEVTNGGGGFLSLPSASISYPATWNGPEWLGASVSGAGAPYKVALQALQSRETTSLEPGTYAATVTVTAPDAADPVTIAVTFHVPPPSLWASWPWGFDMWVRDVAIVNGAHCPPPSPTYLKLTNHGPGTLARPTATVASEAAAGWRRPCSAARSLTASS